MPPSVPSGARRQGTESSEGAHYLPRYSTLHRLVTTGSRPPDVSDAARDADSAASPASSQFTLPAYTEFADFLHRLSVVSPSMMTYPRPPQYSSGVPQFIDAPPRTKALNSEYTFTISSHPKSEPWATLRLYDGNSPVARASKKGRHPRFSNLDKIIGNVELSLRSSQTIKAVEIVLKGEVITGGSGDGGSTPFLDHKYTLWDRRFGDPRCLACGRPSNARYDGKLSGNWIFPFAIPFPSHVDLATRCAVHATGSEGPIRFLPELQDRTLIPFQLGGPSCNTQDPRSCEGSESLDTITPFDATVSHRVTGKRRPRNSPSIPTSIPGVPFDAPVTVAPIPTSQASAVRSPGGTPVLRPYSDPHERIRNGSRFPSGSHPTKGRSPQLLAGGSVHGRTGTSYSGTATTPEPGLLLLANSHPLPQSFLEREVMANIHYELCLVVTHGRLSIKRSRAKSTILYRPITAPPSMPLKRQLSLRQRAIPRSPNLDPDVWKRLPTTWMRGVYLDQQSVAIQCTLHLALPLSYARGTLIPCSLTIACGNPAALGFFANPRTAPRVRLKRLAWFFQSQVSPPTIETDKYASLEFRSPKLGVDGNLIAVVAPKICDGLTELIERGTTRASFRQSSNPGFVAPFTPEGDADGEDFLWSSNATTHRQAIGDNAIWCMPKHYTQERRVRRLYGEIHLPKGLEVTCAFPLFKILYRIELLAPAVGAFVPDATQRGGPIDERVYVSRTVEIVTGVRRDEPVPVPLVGAPISARPGPTDTNDTRAQNFATTAPMTRWI